MWRLIGLLVLVGVGVKYWWVIVVAGLAVFAYRALSREAAREAARRKAEIARTAAISARADQEHNWVMQGDERRFYGQYPPADLVEREHPDA